ncbi:MAG: Transcriptional regulator AraC family [Solirubrobacterales bacterium]|nr:Transcriptional regulator AraC family [Solirubrobacterales bacterium]
MSVMAAAKRTIVLVAFEGMQLLDVVGPGDVFDGATRALAGSGGYRLVVVTPDGQAVCGSSGMRIAADTSLTRLDPRGVDTMIVGGGMDFDVALRDPGLAPALRRLARGARRVCSVCTGAFLLADAGLLDGRDATTHWASCEELARRHASVHVQPDRIYVRDGNVTTSAGVTAGMDLALALVSDDHGPEVARTVARWTVMFLQRPGGQSQFSERLSLPAGAESSVRAVVDAIAADPAADHRLPQLAHRVSMSERHLRRVFAAETNMTPARYVERIRVEAARDLIELGSTPVEQVAAQCGFGSPETMRRAFLRVLGVGPAEYRSRFRAPAAA